MKTDIILAGVGGQGILSIATIIGEAVMNEGLYIKQAEIHGMSQRGGSVESSLRISSEPIYCDLIAEGTADVIISLEPMEALRYTPFLSPEGWIITSSNLFANVPNYPEYDVLKAELSTEFSGKGDTGRGRASLISNFSPFFESISSSIFSLSTESVARRPESIISIFASVCINQ